MADASQPRIDPALLEGGIARAPQAPGQPTPGPSPSPSWYQSLKRWWRGDRSDEPAAGPLARTESVPSGDTSAESADWAPLPYPQYADDEPAAMAEESIPRAGAMVESTASSSSNSSPAGIVITSPRPRASST